jgi:hypothetical protein
MPEHPALKGLYPFLHGERQDPEAMRRALLESVRQKAQDSVSAKEGFFAAQAPAVVAVANRSLLSIAARVACSAWATAAPAAMRRTSPLSSCTR